MFFMLTVSGWITPFLGGAFCCYYVRDTSFLPKWIQLVLICRTSKFVAYWPAAEGELLGIFESRVTEQTYFSCYRVMAATRGDIDNLNSTNQWLMEREIGSSIALEMSLLALLQTPRGSNSFRCAINLYNSAHLYFSLANDSGNVITALCPLASLTLLYPYSKHSYSFQFLEKEARFFFFCVRVYWRLSKPFFRCRQDVGTTLSRLHSNNKCLSKLIPFPILNP